MFKQYSENVNYPKIEEEILKYWEEKKVFEQSISSRSEGKSFTFYEGPPTANGKPGIHHVMARTLKDLVCRYKTLQGYQVHRKAGWDTHGLPVEIEVEKALGIKSKSEIPEFGIQKYNDACRNSVFKYKDLWEQMTTRMGYWIDLDDAYVTFTNNYIESVWWSLKTLFEKGLIYKDYKIVPQCPKSETVLSSHELALGYKMTKDPSVYVLFKIKNSEDYFLVWTTTPWTLVSNVALAVGPDVDYIKIRHNDKNIIMAKDRVSVLNGEYEILDEFKGSTLEHTEYEQLMNYVSTDKKAFYVILAGFVSTEDGSGIVHIAPAFGADDYEISKKYGLPFFQPVTRGGKFTEEVTDFVGQFVKDADPEIIAKLRAEGKLYKKETIEHSYPFSWRFDNVPVIYYARESWFIRTTQFASRMVELNKTINWHPAEVGAGRFGNWLAENKDWALSRDRFWATPLPIWVAEDGDMFAVGSVAELGEGYIIENGVKKYVKDVENIDLHKPFVDNIEFEKNGKIYRRTPELIDVWYDSGAMPFAQYHYPFENKEWFEANFPADYIAEGIDQTRGWFYTLHAISTMLFDKVAYKNILVNDLILDKEGKKMSKSRGNAVDPFELFEKHGADAARWYLISNNPPWRPTMFNAEDLVETQRKFFGTLVNTYNFFALYANIDKFEGTEALVPYADRPEIDRWIISKLNSLVKEYTQLLDGYDVTKAARALSSFAIDELSNWYVRRSRRRFWKSEMSTAKLSAYQTLAECLNKLAILISPIAPFIAEEIYLNMNVHIKDAADSVHLQSLPVAGYIDSELENRMEVAQRVVYLARAIRAKQNIKVRKPLKRVMVVANEEGRKALELMRDVILEEINVKELIALTDDSGIVSKTVKPNFKSIGPKYGKSVKAIAEIIKGFDKDQIATLEAGSTIKVNVDSTDFEISVDDVEIVRNQIEGWIVESDSVVTTALDIELDENLIAEGLAREFVNRVQNMRKDAGFEVTDKINVCFETQEELSVAVMQFADYIKNETLAITITSGKLSGSGYKQEWEIAEFNCTIEVEKNN